MESMSYVHFNQTALSLSTRWAALDRRLLATQEKIEKIKAGLIKVDVNVTKDNAKVPADPEAEQNPREGKGHHCQQKAARFQSINPQFGNGINRNKQKLPLRQKIRIFRMMIHPSLRSKRQLNQTPITKSQRNVERLLQCPMDQIRQKLNRMKESSGPENDAEELPAVSEEFVSQMSEYLTQQEFLKWAYPKYQYAQPTAPP